MTAKKLSSCGLRSFFTLTNEGTSFERFGLYGGSFDPPSTGHLDIILRSKDLFKKLYVGVGIHPTKKPIFSTEDRCNLLRKMTHQYKDKIEIVSFQGLITTFAHHNNIDFLVRGIRSHADLDAEIVMALANRRISGIETLFLLASEEHVHISSSLIRELAQHKIKLDGFIAPEIEEEVYDHLFKYYSSHK